MCVCAFTVLSLNRLAYYLFIRYFIVFVNPKSDDHKKVIWSLLEMCLLPV